PPGPHERRTTHQGPPSPEERLRASGCARQSRPTKGRRTPGEPVRGSCCAERSGGPSSGSSTRQKRSQSPSAHGRERPTRQLVLPALPEDSSPADIEVRRLRSLRGDTRSPAPRYLPGPAAGAGPKGKSG